MKLKKHTLATLRTLAQHLDAFCVEQLERGTAFGLVLYGRLIGVVGFGLFAAWLWALGAA